MILATIEQQRDNLSAEEDNAYSENRREQNFLSKIEIVLDEMV